MNATAPGRLTLPPTLDVDIAGDLCRVDGWKLLDVVRPNYSRHHRDIETVADFKATLRAGPFAWPGGYALYFITADGAALSFKAARREFGLIAGAIRDNETRSGWRVVGLGCTAETDEPVVCDHTGETIE